MVAAAQRSGGAALGFLVAAGLQVSAIEDIRISIGIWSLAAIWALLLLVTWLPVQRGLPVLKRYVPSWEGQEVNVWRQLDSACIYVMKTRHEVELTAAAQRPDKLGTFSPPPDAPGSYGPLSNPEARRAFAKLQELGVIQPTGLLDKRDNIVYRWTDLGPEVLKRRMVRAGLSADTKTD
jgi:hypothetical protein